MSHRGFLNLKSVPFSLTAYILPFDRRAARAYAFIAAYSCLS